MQYKPSASSRKVSSRNSRKKESRVFDEIIRKYSQETQPQINPQETQMGQSVFDSTGKEYVIVEDDPTTTHKTLMPADQTSTGTVPEGVQTVDDTELMSEYALQSPTAPMAPVASLKANLSFGQKEKNRIKSLSAKSLNHLMKYARTLKRSDINGEANIKLDLRLLFLDLTDMIDPYFKETAGLEHVYYVYLFDAEDIIAKGTDVFVKLYYVTQDFVFSDEDANIMNDEIWSEYEISPHTEEVSLYGALENSIEFKKLSAETDAEADQLILDAIEYCRSNGFYQPYAMEMLY